MVEPTVSTKRLIVGGRRRSCSATCRAVGKVALDEAVENAVNIASRTSRKNARGLVLPTSFTSSE